MRRLIAVLGLALAGCVVPAVRYPTNEPKVVFHADVRFSQQTKDCIVYGATKWAEQTDGVAEATVEFDYNGSDIGSMAEHVFDSKIELWSRFEERTAQADAENKAKCERTKKDPSVLCVGTILGRVTPAGGVKGSLGGQISMILVEDRFEDEHACKLVALHEFGHAFGVPHLSNPAAIMYPEIRTQNTECLKELDLTAFCTVNSSFCTRDKTMKPCEKIKELDNGITTTDLKSLISSEEN